MTGTPPPTGERRETWTLLGQMLLRRQAITDEQLQVALDKHRQTCLLYTSDAADEL